MEEEKYLSDIVNPDELQDNKLNLVEAPCGSGKTTFVKNIMIKQSRVGDILFLIDTRRGKEQIKEHGEYREYNRNWYYRVEDITVMTYACFASMVLNKRLEWSWDEYSIIVCDELQSCIKYSKLQSDGVNLHKLALDYIHERIKGESNLVIAISATPRKIRTEFAKEIVDVPLHGTPKSYKNHKTIYYSNLDLLAQKLPSDKRGIIYISRIVQIEKLSAVLNSRGIKTVGIWSENNTKHPMNEEQIAVSNSIVKHECVPDNVQVLLINASSETSINIQSHTDYVVVHSSDRDTQVQARGRYRDNLDILYLYDSEAQSVELPDYMLNTPLFKEDVGEFIKANNLRNKKRELISVTKFYSSVMNNGYSLAKTKLKGGKRYTVITEQ